MKQGAAKTNFPNKKSRFGKRLLLCGRAQEKALGEGEDWAYWATINPIGGISQAAANF
jgi:hypothetical protein